MKKSVIVASHLLFWIFTFLSAPRIFYYLYFQICYYLQFPGGPPKGRYTIEDDYLASFIIVSIGACIFYTAYFLLKYFVKHPLFFFWNFVCYLTIALIFSLPADLVSYSVAIKLGPILYFNVFGFLYRACLEWFEDRKIKSELEKDKIASQLELLKAKLDPHFLFNNLNNIDVFIQEDPKQASEYLRKLSEILRFMLYETNSEKILLSSEIDYIHKYIDLQKIRTVNESFVKFELKSDFNKQQIAPMVLIHFIENAFKYASNKKIENAVNIHLEISDKLLTFNCKNHVAFVEPESGTKGLGIRLLTHKLDLLYGKKYTLSAKKENDWYEVKLEIKLHDN